MLILIKSLLVNGSGAHLWFLPAVILYSLFVHFFILKDKINTFFRITLFLFIFGLLIGTYDVLQIKYIFNPFYFRIILRVFFMGLPVFSLGLFIRYHIEHILLEKKLFSLIVTFICSFLELKLLNRTDVISSFFLPLFTANIFIVLINNNNNNLYKTGKFCKCVSSFMYYSHPLVNIALLTILHTFLKLNINENGILTLVLIISLLLGLIIYKLNNKFISSFLS